MKSLLQFFLNLLARAYIWRFKPVIIAVTGNVGKTSTKEAIACVLGSVKRVRSSGGNLNNEFGVPLTILGDWHKEYYEKGPSLWFWLKVLFYAKWGFFFNRKYPEVLILEFGADRPGDIEKLAKIFKPKIGIVTAVGEVPVHVEYFSGPEQIAEEKSKLISALNVGDNAILNFDDLAVLEMKRKSRAKVTTFGFGEGADIRISGYTVITSGELGIIFKLERGEHTFVPVKINGTIGKSQAYAAAAAAAVGLSSGMNLVTIREALASYQGPAGRLKILKGIKNTTIIDDTYNAAPASTHNALETLKQFTGRRRIAVLGDMLELGKYSVQAHQVVGDMAGSVADILVCVGSSAKFIADSAGNQMPSDRIYRFDTSEDAKMKIKELLHEADVALVKGSQGIRMEKIVEEIMAEPEKKKELLVRQSKKWLSK
jgi:UDP-N-acetylmuramoyl-tripeptide--D-alanyl-D-alanine ligase